MKAATFKIEGMRCDGCAQTIKMVAGQEPGVTTRCSSPISPTIASINGAPGADAPAGLHGFCDLGTHVRAKAPWSR
jgi:hypothetical protein